MRTKTYDANFGRHPPERFTVAPMTPLDPDQMAKLKSYFVEYSTKITTLDTEKARNNLRRKERFLAPRQSLIMEFSISKDERSCEPKGMSFRIMCKNLDAVIETCRGMMRRVEITSLELVQRRTLIIYFEGQKIVDETKRFRHAAQVTF